MSQGPINDKKQLNGYALKSILLGTRNRILVLSNQFARSEAKLPTASDLLSPSHFPGRERCELPAVGWSVG